MSKNLCLAPCSQAVLTATVFTTSSSSLCHQQLLQLAVTIHLLLKHQGRNSGTELGTVKSDPRGPPGPWTLQASSAEQQISFSSTGLTQAGAVSPLATDSEAGGVTCSQSDQQQALESGSSVPLLGTETPKASKGKIMGTGNRSLANGSLK